MGERIRLAMGHSIRSASEQGLLSDGVDKTAIREKYYEPPLINIIKYACHACPDTHYEVTNACQHCLAHHCSNSCPKGAEYGQNELRNPTRVLTTTVCVEGGLYPRIPVKTSRAIPKGLLMDAMAEVAKVRLVAPVRRGQVILPDLLGTGADLVASRDMDAL